MDEFWPFNILGSDKGRRECAPMKVGYNALLDIKFVEGSNAPNEPISLDYAKAWMKLDLSDDDALITDLITSSRELCESWLNISIIPRTIIATINNINGNSYLPYGPVVELLSMQDAKGCAIDPTCYCLQLEDFKRLAYPKLDYIRLEYTAGYANVPRRLITGILQQLLWNYEHRGDEEHIGRGVDISSPSPDAMATLLPFRRVD